MKKEQTTTFISAPFVKNNLYSDINDSVNGIIKDIIDNDVYKFFMMQVVFLQYPNSVVKYKFVNRGLDDLAPYMYQVKKEIDKLENLNFNQTNLEFFYNNEYFKPAFIEYLRTFKLNPRKDVHLSINNGKLEIEVNGNWLNTILYEIFILAIVSEVRNINKFPNIPFELVRKKVFENSKKLKNLLKEKGLKESDFKFSEFGTRRRLSYAAQEYVVDFLHREFPDSLNGTSNCHFSNELKITAIGTMAHEYLCAHQAIVNPKNSLKEALEVWNNVYRGSLGIALTDAITTDVFLDAFDKSLSKLFDGVRHDSGDPIIFGEKMIAHYKKLKIDPTTKTLIFSDSLDFEKAVNILAHFKGRINVAFGIGTFLTNNVDYVNELGEKYTALNIVMKMVEFNGHPVAKISDEPVKAISEDPYYFLYLINLFKIEIDLKKVKYIDLTKLNLNL